MSSSNSDREMLLSAALDGELSLHEQAEFDRLISNDPTFAGEFDELQALRADLRSCMAELRTQKLPPSATQRMVAAAMVETERSLPSTKPAIPQNDDQHGAWPAKSKWVAAVLALAASVIVAIGVWPRGDAQSTTSPNLIAQIAPDESASEVSEEARTLSPEKMVTPSIASTLTPTTAVTPEPATQVLEQPTAPLKPAVSDVESIAATLPAASDSRPKVMGIKPDALASTDNKLTKPIADPAMAIDASESVAKTPDATRKPLEVLLMFSVELNQPALGDDAINEALQASGIRLDKDSAIDANVVSQLKTASFIEESVGQEGSASPKLYFIEASAKQLDRFMDTIYADTQTFGSVGMSLVMQPPLLAAVGDMRVIDPTKVRQDESVGLARGFVVENGAPWAVNSSSFARVSRDEFVDLQLIQQTAPADAPIDPNGSASTGEDFPAQLLLLVK